MTLGKPPTQGGAAMGVLAHRCRAIFSPIDSSEKDESCRSRLIFEVFKALTGLRYTEADSYNDVIRRLLSLPDDEAPSSGDAQDCVIPANYNVLANIARGHLAKDGAWIGNVHFPNGTRFRATYKGRTFRAEIKDNVWIDESGVIRQSPSEAASAISKTSVNGWRFWYGLRPHDEDWHRLDEFRK